MDINEPVNKAKKLNIIVLCDNSEAGYCALLHGVQLALAFDSSLSILTDFDFNLTSKSDANKFLIDKDILNNVDYQIITDHYFPETLFNFAEKTNTAMIVIGISNDDKKALFSSRKAIKFIKESRFPVMTATQRPVSEDDYRSILLPLDIERQNKEKALWAGYFNRFHGAKVHILTPEYKDEGLAKLVQDNLDFVKKIYTNLEIEYDTASDKNSSYFDEYALNYAKNNDIRVSTIMMTKYYTLADLITGPRERRIIGKSEIPILCINQRDDLYILCT